MDVRRQIEQIHDLRQTRPADMAELGEFGANVSITSGYPRTLATTPQMHPAGKERGPSTRPGDEAAMRDYPSATRDWYGTRMERRK